MPTSIIVKVLVSFLSGAVAAGSASYLVDANLTHALTAALAAGITTALAYIKESPMTTATMAISVPVPHDEPSSGH